MSELRLRSVPAGATPQKEVRENRSASMEPAAKVCTRCGRRFHAAAAFCQGCGVPLVHESDSPDPYIGKVLLDQFRIEELIGVGGMGSVYRAHQQSLDRDVAIKILHQDLTSNPDAVRRFRREARITTKLDHPNVVNVFLFGQLPDGSMYLVMEHLSGRPLSEILHTEGRLPPHRALHIAAQICDGVGEAHAHNVVHRDVKPENVLIVRRGRDPDFVKVLDFGIARLLLDEHTVATQSGLIFGTARYISPEGAAGEPTDSRSDVYSIGVLTYQLLCGQAPFDAPSPVAMLMKHIHDVAPDIRTRTHGAVVPEPVAEVIMAALSKDPSHRYPDAAAFGAALREAAAASGIPLAVSGYRQSFTPSLPPPTPTPVAPPAPILAEAPSPFGGTTAFSIPGLHGQRRGIGVIPTIMIAFVLGAAAVTSGAWLVGALGRDRTPYVEPGPPPRSEPAPVVESTPPEPEPPLAPEPGLRTVPAEPVERQPVTLVAVLDANEELPEGARPVFRLHRAGQRVRGEVRAGPAPDGRSWLASYVFTRPGRYEIRLVYGKRNDTTVLVTDTVEVARRGSRPQIAAPSTTQVQASPEPTPAPMVPTQGDTIDWSAPPVGPRTQMTTTMTDPGPAPLEPWPGAGTPPSSMVSPTRMDEPPEPWTGSLM